MIISVLVGLYFVLMGTVLIRRGAVNWRREVSFAPRLRSLPFTDAANADFHAANWTPLSGVFVVEGASAEPGDGGVGDVGLSQDG